MTDLIFVDGDPLADLSVLREPAIVMVNGNLYTRDKLQEMLEANAESFEREGQQMPKRSGPNGLGRPVAKVTSRPGRRTMKRMGIGVEIGALPFFYHV